MDDTKIDRAKWAEKKTECGLKTVLQGFWKLQESNMPASFATSTAVFIAYPVWISQELVDYSWSPDFYLRVKLKVKVTSVERITLLGKQHGQHKQVSYS